MGGGSKPRSPKPPVIEAAPDPEAARIREEEGKRKDELEKRSRKGTTIATSPQGVLGEAPINAPKLSAKLGQGA